ncbi:hypothetical protein [Yoonia litorea]|uniref:hypothetical protein n=1 Tax=Yoonia litorea TaxID=1123755 RepID=UPI0013F4CD79|nr:hypothetical protein [Yoonia litorea]
MGQKKTQNIKPAAQKQLEAAQVAKLFQKGVEEPKEYRPAKLNAHEIKERDALSSLRGALYKRKR